MYNMLDEIKKLAKEKGFNSEIIGKYVDSKYSDKDFYYLWLCELKKWLLDEKLINIIVFNDDGDVEKGNLRFNYEIRFIIYSFKFNDKNSLVGHYHYMSYDEALEKGIKRALKTI